MDVVRTDWTDWYRDGERSAVFADGHVMVLSELATALVTWVGDGASSATLADALVDEFGPPDGVDALAATEATIRELVGRGVLGILPADPQEPA